MSSYRGKGKVYTTNYRLIFLKENPSATFSSCCIPYLNIVENNSNKKDKSTIRLKKQLFGGCIISSKVYPVRNGGLQRGGPSKFEIKFDDTGTGKQFYSTLEKHFKVALKNGKHSNDNNHNSFYSNNNNNSNNNNSQRNEFEQLAIHQVYQLK